MPRTIVVVPTYNEAENLPLLVPAVLEQDPSLEVLVVDDNSPDGTGKLADELERKSDRVHVLHRASKQGLGAAYRAGLERALELGADQVMQMDCDFSHPPDALPTMLAEMKDHDVVLGSRYLNGITVVNWPIERILISYFGNWYARKVTGLPVSDITGGFRCMRRGLLERVGFESIRSDGYAFQIEMKYNAKRLGFSIAEVPITFVDRVLGSSKMSLNIFKEAFVGVLQMRGFDIRPADASDPS